MSTDSKVPSAAPRKRSDYELLNTCTIHAGYSAITRAVPCSMCSQPYPMNTLFGYYLDIPYGVPTRFIPPDDLLVMLPMDPYGKPFTQKTFFDRIKYLYCSSCLRREHWAPCSVCPDTWIDSVCESCGGCEEPGCTRSSCYDDVDCGSYDCNEVVTLCCAHLQRQACPKCDDPTSEQGPDRDPPRVPPFVHCRRCVIECDTCDNTFACISCLGAEEFTRLEDCDELVRCAKCVGLAKPKPKRQLLLDDGSAVQSTNAKKPRLGEEKRHFNFFRPYYPAGFDLDPVHGIIEGYVMGPVEELVYRSGRVFDVYSGSLNPRAQSSDVYLGQPLDGKDSTRRDIIKWPTCVTSGMFPQFCEVDMGLGREYSINNYVTLSAPDLKYDYESNIGSDNDIVFACAFQADPSWSAAPVNPQFIGWCWPTAGTPETKSGTFYLVRQPAKASALMRMRGLKLDAIAASYTTERVSTSTSQLRLRALAFHVHISFLALNSITQTTSAHSV